MFDARKLAAEFMGTAILVLVAVGVATENFGFKLFGTSTAAGLPPRAALKAARMATSVLP